MTDERGVLLATQRGAMTLKRLLAHKDSATSSSDHLDPDAVLEAVAAELFELPTDGDDYSRQRCRQVRRVNDEINYLLELKVRLLGGRPLLIQAGTQTVPVSTSLHVQCQLIEDLEPAADGASYVGAATNPLPTALANVLIKDSNGGLTRLMVDGNPEQIRIVNRNEHWETVPTHTVGRALILNDEWQPDDFDCDARTGGLIL